ncbi:MAG: protein kinase [Rhodanobacteraceae bacterium]
MRIEIGSVFAGYTIVKQLGRGGMATVYLVREPGINRLVALKVLPEDLAFDANFAARFEQEARVIGGLDHPTIIPLYRYGITHDVPWMALRYVDGGDFAMRLAARPLPLPDGLSLLRSVASALDYAHRKSVIHRDLKPQNILLTSDGSVYLADFGVAKLLEGTFRLKTATGSVMGTPAYMAPEQAKSEQLGPYTDAYALAVICFQWLTGSLPFDADTPYAILMKHVTEPVPPGPLGLLAPKVAQVLERGLAKLPEDRFQAASTLIAQLEHALYSPSTRSLTTASVPASRVDPSMRDRRMSETPVASTGSTHRRKTIALIVLALVLSIGAYAYWREVLQPAAEQRAVAAAKQTADVAAAKLVSAKSNAEKRAADEAAAKQAESTQASLIVKADAACRLTVNGEAKGALQANKAKILKLNPGEQLIECTTSEDLGATTQETKTVSAGAQAVVVLAVAEAIASAKQQRAVAEQAAQERAARAGFVDLGNGVLKDTKTGRQWTQSDNGFDIDWDDAKSYCERMGGGWRLPSVDELAAIYDARVPSPKECATGHTCKVSHLFNLTGELYWSGTHSGSTEAWTVYLTYGGWSSDPMSISKIRRALCARRS